MHIIQFSVNLLLLKKTSISEKQNHKMCKYIVKQAAISDFDDITPKRKGCIYFLNFE